MLVGADGEVGVCGDVSCCSRSHRSASLAGRQVAPLSLSRLAWPPSPCALTPAAAAECRRRCVALWATGRPKGCTGVWRSVSASVCLVCLVSGVWCLVSGVWCLVTGVCASWSALHVCGPCIGAPMSPLPVCHASISLKGVPLRSLLGNLFRVALLLPRCPLRQLPRPVGDLQHQNHRRTHGTHRCRRAAGAQRAAAPDGYLQGHEGGGRRQDPGHVPRRARSTARVAGSRPTLRCYLQNVEASR